MVIPAMLLLAVGCKKPKPAPAPPPPVTAPSSMPATTQAAMPPTLTYIDIVRRVHPAMTTTRPLDAPLGLKSASHLLFRDGATIDSMGGLWITHPDGEDGPSFFETAIKQDVHITPHRVAFVCWRRDPQDKRGRLMPSMVTPSPNGGFDLLDIRGRRPIPMKATPDWSRARQVDDVILVPTDTGVSALDFAAEAIHELPSPPLADKPQPPGVIQILQDFQGYLAWAPAGECQGTPTGVARFVQGSWHKLDGDRQWPAQLIHLVPLLDGSVLLILPDGDGRVRMQVSSLDQRPLDESAIGRLIEQLSDDHAATREEAFKSLSRYGPRLGPILEKRIADQPAEAKIRMRELMTDNLALRFGGMMPVQGKMRLVSRFNDGGALFHAPDGVQLEKSADADAGEIVSPAWICLRPGESASLLTGSLARALDPERSRPAAFDSEWVNLDPADGPQRLAGDEFTPILRPGERGLSHIIGVDARGRWLFREPGKPPWSKTLVLDPTLPDVTPRLPVWRHTVTDGSVGWNSDGWPVMKKGGAWLILEAAFRPLDESTDRMFTTMDDMPATRPTTFPADGENAPPLLIDRAGRRHYDGMKELRVYGDGGRIVWPLPETAQGGRPATLIETDTGRLFLFNDPNKVSRIRPTGGASEPFVLEAVFRKNVPEVENPTRIWLDPAGRIVIAYDTDGLAVLYPKGFVPSAAATMIPTSELDDEDEGIE